MSYGHGHETGSRRQRPAPLPTWAQDQYQHRIQALEAEEAAWLEAEQQQREAEEQWWQWATTHDTTAAPSPKETPR